MLDAFMKESIDMHIIQGIKAGAPRPSNLHQTQVPQSPQMMTHSGLTHFEKLREIAHTMLTFRQNPDDSNARSIPQRLKSPSQKSERFFGFQGFRQG
jgi:hypothetical protein